MCRAARACLTLLAVAAPVSAQAPLTAGEERGRQIYELGTSPSSSAIEARIGGDTRVSAAIVPCVNCHGRDGLGKPEGGVLPSNNTWEALTKPYGVVHPDGRMHPAYTERLLIRAITMGADPAGNELNLAMPRFNLSQADAASLVSYIKRLGKVAVPGVSAETIRLGVILRTPANWPLKQAYLDYCVRLNAAGGIFGRRIELTFVALPADPSQRAEAVRAFLQAEPVFAILGDFAGAEAALSEVMRQTDTPAVAAFAAFPADGAPGNRQVFYLDRGLAAEIEALVRFGWERFPGPDRSITIVAEDDVAERIRRQLTDTGRRRVAISSGNQPVSGELVYWARRDLARVSLPASVAQRPAFLIPGSFLDPSDRVPAGARVFVAQPARSVSERAAASAALVAEGLRAAGRGLSRATFRTALEQVLRTLPNPAPIAIFESSAGGFISIRE